MAKLQLALIPGEPKRLELQWKGLYKNGEVRFDGQQVGEFANNKVLKAGVDITLPDGSPLHIQLVQKFGGARLKITHDGLPLRGGPGGPEGKLKGAVGVAYFIGGVNTLLGILALTGVELLARLGFGPISIGIGVLFFFLAVHINKRSMAALTAAVVIYGIDVLLAIYIMVEAGGRIGGSGLFIRVFFLIALISGFGAIRELNQTDVALSDKEVESAFD